MEEIIIYLLKSAGVLSIFVLTYHFLLRRLTFFNANRWFLIFGLIASIAFPLIEITQTVYVEKPDAVYLPEQIMTPMAYTLQEPVAQQFLDLNQMLLYLYAAISLFFIGKMGVELLSLHRLIRSGKRRKENGFIRVSLSRKVTPFSFFKYICFYEEEENSPANELILKHEQVHAREWHSMDLLLTHVYCAIFWINPLAWWLKRQIGENLEFIADATAKVENTTGISYERTLLSSAASHMQPALANNFFTPFIKKRIQMLQKETSKTWNAYKYALILPVIVLFLYSFNTVTKTEYVKSELGISQSSEEPLMFDITSATSQQELNRFIEIINDYAEFKMDLRMRTLDSGNKALDLYTAFENKKLFNNFSMEFTQGKLLLLEVSKDQVKTYNTLTQETIVINIKGTTIGDSEPLLFKNLAISLSGQKTPMYGTSQHDSKKIEFTIPATTTKEGLDRIKTQLNTDYNVDLNYKNLKYKKGKIVRIKLQLDDNRGSKISKNINGDDPIDPICITGVMKEDNEIWSMANCKERFVSNKGKMSSIPGNSRYFKSGDSIFFDLKEFKGMDLDSIKQSMNLQLQKMKFNMDDDNWQRLNKSLKEVQSKFEKMDVDSLRRFIESSTLDLRTFNMDSINAIYKRNFNSRGYKSDSLNLGRYKKLFIKDTIGTDLGSIRMKNNGSFNFKKEIADDKEGPLYVLNNKIMDVSIIDNIDPNAIKSVEVLKDGPAIEKYGEAGKNGVVIIETKVGLNRSKAAFKKNQSSVQTKTFNPWEQSLTIYTPASVDGMFQFSPNEDPYILVNNKKTTVSLLNQLDPNTIKLIQVWKGSDALEKYGASGKDGVVDVVLKTPREMKLSEDELQNEMFSNTWTEEPSTAWSSITTVTYSMKIDKFTNEEFEKLKKSIKAEGYDFNLRTLRKTGNKVTKLKFDLDGTAYTYEPDTGMKSLTITIDELDKKPKVSAVSY